MSAATPAVSRRRSAPLAALLTFGLLLLGLVVPGVASADTRPDAGSPATVAADALGTVQVNGVVWAMTTVGNTVYATGSFTRARPAGSAAGTNETARANLVAFNLTTGVMTTFNHTLNGQGRAITASPDGTRVYVGGDFTTVDGVARNHVAAFTVSTGALVTTFAPSVSGGVYSLAATNSTVYVGGNFTVAGGQSRSRLAAFSASNGALTTFAPSPNHIVRGIVLSPDGTRVVFAGQFATVNGTSAVALASTDLNGGDLRTWNAGFTNAGDAGGAYSLRTDGTNLYVTMYGFLVGNVEGTMAVNPNTLALIWMNDCHGDPYDTFATGGVVYTAGHVHDCETSGNYPNPVPTIWKRVIANTTATNGCTLKATTQTPRYTSWTGRPCPGLLTFFPTLAAGSFTGQAQAAWALTGNSNYLVLGGEFPTVNGTGQQGLVRMATTNIAPNRRGPELTAAQMQPSATSTQPGQVTVTWPSSWDMDNQNLTYSLFRTGTTAAIYTTTVKSDWWNRQNLRFTETRPVGSTAGYSVRVTDPIGNTVTSTTSPTVTVASASSAYANQVLTDNAQAYWRLGETTGTTAADYASNYNLAERAGITRAAAGVISGDGGVSANGTSTGIAITQQYGQNVQIQQNLSVEAWVRTTSTAGGVIAQYGNSASGANTQSDRTLYVDSQGRLSFGYTRLNNQTNVTTYTTLQSPAPINNGQWHHVVATLGSNGTSLFVDGAQVANVATMTRPNTSFTGYWMVGGGTLAGWTNAPTSSYLNGSLDEVAIYAAALTPAQVANHYSLATGAATNPSPTASFTSTTSGLTVNVDGSASTDTAPGTVASYAWNWGDGQTTAASPSATTSHTYTAGGPYTVTLTVTDNGGATGTTTRAVNVTDPNNTPPTASFTATPNGLTVNVNGSASSDAQGPIASYAWNWGDGQTTPAGTTATASHTYAAAGTFTVTLTVRDSANASGTSTQAVTVSSPQGAAFASDAFARTVGAGGWGNADTGGAWTAQAGATRLSVTPGAGILDLPTAATSQNTGAYLGGVSQASADVTTSFTLSSVPTGGGTDVYLTPRRLANGDDIRVRARIDPLGAITLTYSRRIAGAETFGGNVAVTGVTWTTGSTLTMRVQTSTTAAGTTTRARIWVSTATEPTTWQLTQTNDTNAALQGSGGVGISAFRGSTSTGSTQVRVSSFVARPVA